MKVSKDIIYNRMKKIKLRIKGSTRTPHTKKSYKMKRDLLTR